MDFLAHICVLLATVFYAFAATGYTGLAEARLLGGGENKRYALMGGAFFHFCFLVFSKLALLDTGLENLFGLPYTLCIISLLLVILYLGLERWLQLEGLGALVSPLALMLTIASGLLFHFLDPAKALYELDAIVTFHIIATILGNVFFLFAFLVSITLLIQESSIRKKRTGALWTKLPSLQVLDKLNSGVLSSGFILMSIGVSVGLVVISLRGMAVDKLDLRLLTSFLTLAVYGVLVAARVARGWRGRRVAWLSVAGFTTVVFSMLSLRLFGDSFHVY